MSRYAGSALGVDITDFMGQGPDFGGLGNQALVDNAKNYGLGEVLNGKINGAIMNAEAQVAAAKELGKAQLAGTPGAMDGIARMAPSIAGMIDFGGGGGGNPVGGFGSTGFGNTFNAGSIGKYGTPVTDPMESFRAAGITGPIYDFQS